MIQKTALVLSAGGMFGAYQAGAYREIEERFPIDLVVGASVGALNGWPIAGGCGPEHLMERWLKPETGKSLTLLPNAGWRNGWFDPEPLRALAEDLYRSYTPQIPFGLVMVQVPWFRTRLVKHPDIRPEHLQATCSIPLFLPTVQIGGGRFLDGGLFDKLPLAGAIAMGATRIIAVDSLPELGPRWMRRGMHLVKQLRGIPRLPQEMEITIISPSESLGGARDAVFWNEKNARRWIELGAKDARRVLSQRDLEPLPLGKTLTEANPEKYL